MSDVQADLDQSREMLLARLSVPGPAPELHLDAATPLSTLPPVIVALIVGRVQAGLPPLGPKHPRTAIVPRVVVPSIVLGLLDLVGLVVALASGHYVLAVGAALLLVVLLYLTMAGIRFVHQDPLRVSPAQTAHVAAAKQWRSAQGWPDDVAAGPWARLVSAAVDATAQVSASTAWTWASIAPQRARIDLAATLDAVDTQAHSLAMSQAVSQAVSQAMSDPTAPFDQPVVARVAALTLYARRVDALPADLAAALPADTDRDLNALLDAVLRNENR